MMFRFFLENVLFRSFILYDMLSFVIKWRIVIKERSNGLKYNQLVQINLKDLPPWLLWAEFRISNSKDFRENCINFWEIFFSTGRCLTSIVIQRHLTCSCCTLWACGRCLTRCRLLTWNLRYSWHRWPARKILSAATSRASSTSSTSMTSSTPCVSIVWIDALGS